MNFSTGQFFEVIQKIYQFIKADQIIFRAHLKLINFSFAKNSAPLSNYKKRATLTPMRTTFALINCFGKLHPKSTQK